MKMSLRIPALFLGLLLLTAGFALALKDGDPAPDFSGRTLAGEEFSLSGLRGRPVILKLATTWCPTCLEQSHELEKVADFLQQNKIPVVEVFFQESEKTVRSYLEKYSTKVTPMALTDEGKIFGEYSVYLIPRILIIDSAGIVRRDGGLLKADKLVEQVTPLLP